MKLEYWVTIAAASAVWGPACVLAQMEQERVPLPMPQSSESRLASTEGLLPHSEPPIPNRSVPSLEPPQPGDIYPITPKEAWPKQLPSTKSPRPSVESGADNMDNDDALLGKDEPETEEPLPAISDPNSPIGK